MQEMQVATHSSILVGNPKDRGAWWILVRGVVKEKDTTSNYTTTTNGSSWADGPQTNKQAIRTITLYV